MLIKKIKARRILNPSGIPGCFYALNPYTGCSNNCTYCYASFMLRFVKTDREWGDFVFIKENAPLLLRKELKRIKKGRICIGTVCDPYLGLESQYHLTRKILDQLTAIKNTISIQTKNQLILRDTDLLKRIKNLEILITITTTDEEIQRILEPDASPIKERIKTIETLTGAGFTVDIFAGPLLPGLSDDQGSIDRLISIGERTGAGSILFDTLNPYAMVRKRMIQSYQKNFPKKLKLLNREIKDHKEYQKKIRKEIKGIARRKDISVKILF